MSRGLDSKTAGKHPSSPWPRCVPLLAAGVILAACSDETGITPPDPLRAVGLGSNEFVVTTTEDTEACDSPPGECSLRGAILAANDDAEGGPYTIVLEAGETYTLTIGRLPVRAAVVIEGNGATIEQTIQEEVLEVRDSLQQELVKLTLENVTVTGGRNVSRPGGFNGGGINVRNAMLMLSHSTVAGNDADFNGGGIYARGSTMVLTNSRVSDNTVAEFGGGIYADDGSDVTVTNSVVSGNDISPDIELEGIVTEGGGIEIRDDSHLTLIRSTVSDNNSYRRGGGIGIRNSSAAIVNTTVSNNSVHGSDDGAGSGIYVVSVSSGSNATVALVNSTVTGNTSSNGAAGIRSAGAEVTLSNTIVARQASGPDCIAVSTSQGPGVITSLGHNLDSDGSCGLGAPGDHPNANANLGRLAENGGPTQTHELLEGSDAIDAGDDAVCAAEPVNGADQRGIARPQARSCDIGAFEREFDPFPTAMTAEPALLDIEGGLLGLRLRLLNLSARVVRTDTRAPIEGETITMTVGRQRGGSQVVCSAVTDADGVATCSGGLRSLLGLVLSGYSATFAGTWQYEPSSAGAPVIRVDSRG